MYQFVLCQTHLKCPDLKGWYLILKPDDLAAFMEVHLGVVSLYNQKYGINPHLTPAANPFLARLYNPIRLSTEWLETVERHRKKGITLAVNSNGGMMPLADLIVLKETESDRLRWPDRYEDEIITISKWPEAKHYYLCSNRDRIFVPDKYLTYQDAEKEAKQYTDKIESRC